MPAAIPTYVAETDEQAHRDPGHALGRGPDVHQRIRRPRDAPCQIAVAAGQSAKVGMSQLLFFTALVSVNLAVLNLLPVPMLDGGHLLFFACEAVLGRPISVRKREIAQQVGFVLLMMLMVFALYNDVSRLGWLHFLR